MVAWRWRPPPGLGLHAGERVLAKAATPNGPAVATDRRLVFRDTAGVTSVSWDDVERAAWNGEERVLVVFETTPLGGRAREHRLRIEDGRSFLDVVREQVDASIVIIRQVPIRAGRGVEIIGRRRYDRTVRWVVRPDAGLDVGAAEIRDQIAAAVAQVRAEVE